MLVLNFQRSLSLMILIQRCLSIPFDYSDFSVPDLNSDYTSFPQDEYSNTDSNLLAFLPNDAAQDTTSDPNLLDYSLFDNGDWLSSSTQPDDNLLGTFGDMTIAGSGAMCPLGKREDGLSCKNNQQPIKQQPLPPLDLDGLSAIFGITNNNGGSGTQNGDLGTDAGVGFGSSTQTNPCLLTPPYLVHACCDGPEGMPNGEVYSVIQSCSPGTCTHGNIGPSSGRLLQGFADTYTCPPSWGECHFF